MKRLLSILLTLTLLLGLMPLAALPVYAGHVCPNCDEWIDGSPYCEYCYECAECCELCLECGICADCSGWEICEENCGDNGPICVDCALDQGRHCPDCYDCYLETQVWCDECGRCSDCSENCWDCSIAFGKSGLCVECSIEEGGHCPECEGCYGPVMWCQECGLCENCSALCVDCSSEIGEYICGDCAIDAGMHCTDCQGCYGESNWEYCSECGICANCVEYCDSYDLCLYCAIDNGYHCPSCEGCCEDEPICESCGEACMECADDFCESCGLCSNCVQVCPSCGACSECAEICPNCGEYCSDCEDLCDDCEFCLVCCADIAAFEGCDCSDWVCVESTDWQEHCDEEHRYTAEDGHTARPVKSWSWDENRHWQVCLHCDDAEHYSNRFAHTYDKRGMCTVCNYAKNSNIQILKQPQDVKNVKVRSPYEDCDGSNLAHFSVQAVGKSELTYTWYERRYIGANEWEYVPLKNPDMGEKYTGPDLYIYAGTDACYTTRYYMCIITDEEGNQARTVEVALQGQHNYQYFKYYQGDYPSDPYENAATAPNYHNLQCVGEGCEKTVSIRPHEDENEDDECDICRRDMPEILITQQPKADSKVMVTSSDEDPLENNYAKYSVKAVGKSKLTYTWCRRVYTAPGQFHYVPLTNPREGEVFDGPDARILAPEDACTNTYVYRCIITDEEGNTAETIDVVMEAKHNYQYYKYYKSQTGKYVGASRRETCHKAVCVGNDCGKVSRLTMHVDVDKDFQCDICYYINAIDELRVDFALPVSGNKPDYNMTVDISACYIRGNGIDRTYRRWYESDNGVDGWRLMSATDTFKAGKYYNVEVDVATISGREFSTYNYPATTHTVWLWTYDKRGKLLQTGSLSHKNYATLTMDTPYYCQPQEIGEIAVSGVDQPIAGQKPDYEIGLDTDGYKQDTGSTLYSKKGVAWKRVNDTEAMHVDGTFIAGYVYQCRITLIAEENRVFAPGAVATVNGQPATVELYDNNRMAVVSYEYQVPTARVREIHLTGVQNPWEGTEVDWYAETNSDLFCVDEFSWHDLTLDEAHYGAFVPGHQYEIGFYLVTQMVDGHFQCEFDENTVVTVNGRPATVLSVDWDGWTGSSIYFTYLCPPTGEKVRLVTAPTSVEVDEGETASVSLTAIGTDLTYTWYYKDKGGDTFKKTDTFTGPSYSVEMNESRDGRQVYCVVTDGSGNFVTTDTVTLSMKKTAVTITSESATASYAKMGGKVSAKVTATGDGLKYQWYIKNDGKTTYSKSSVTSATYSATMSDKAKNRRVYCIVTDQYGNKVQSKTFILRESVSITKEPATAAYAKKGAKVSVKITASGDGLKYTWYVKNDGASKYTKSSVTSSTYSVTMSDKVKGRKIYCIVTDKYGKKVQSKTFLLREAVSIVTQPKTVTVAKNKTAKVTVKASGDGLKYTWYVKDSGKTKYSKSSITKSTYSVKMTSKVNGRYVYCVVKDKYGKTVKTVTVKLKMK